MSWVSTSALPMASRNARLRPPTPEFLDELYYLASTNEIPWQWRTAVETPDSFRESLWQDVMVLFAIENARDGRSAGLLTGYGANLVHGYAYVSMMLHPRFRLRVWPLEGVLLFANYLFTKFDLLNLYAETVGPYFEQFRSGVGTFFEVEAHYRNRVVVNGQREDVYVLTFTRDRWLTDGVPLLERSLPRDRRRALRQVQHAGVAG